MGNVMNARYRALPETLFHPDLGNYDSYSIVYEEHQNDTWIVSRKIADVSDSSAAVSGLVQLLNDGELSPCHLLDTIENWLNK